MDYSSISDNLRLAYIIKNAFEIEWMKYSMYQPGNIYARIPALCFRFADNKENQKEIIEEILEGYKGIYLWTIFANPFSKKNLYIISISEYKDYCFVNYEKFSGKLKASNYFGEEQYKSMCENSIRDLMNLCMFMECKLHHSQANGHIF